MSKRAKAAYRIKYEKQLGMSMGAANNKLKKKILYFLASELNRINCIRCGELLNEDDFTIDHKKPWRLKDSRLFWDVKNIGFSHQSCNNSHTTRRLSTHCKNGHKWTKENTKRHKNYKSCRACDRDRWEKRKEIHNRNRRIKRLSKTGKSTREIAKLVGISNVAVYKVLTKK